MTLRRLAASFVAFALIAACGQSAEEACEEYRSELLSLIVPAGDALADRAADVRAYQQGDVEVAQLNEDLAASEAEMDQLLLDIDALGEPPEELTDGVQLINDGVAKLGDAFGLADGLAIVTDEALNEQYGTMTREGIELLQQGADSLDCGA